jgi:hypothetical protein
MRIALYGSKWFGKRVLEMLQDRGDQVVQVVAPPDDHWLALAASTHGYRCISSRLALADLIPAGRDGVAAAGRAAPGPARTRGRQAGEGPVVSSGHGPG